jgi:hypothetical protein
VGFSRIELQFPAVANVNFNPFYRVLTYLALKNINQPPNVSTLSGNWRRSYPNN